MNIVSFLAFTVPLGLYFGFTAPWLFHYVSPVLPIITAYIFFLALMSFFKAAFSDPGILPQNLHITSYSATEHDFRMAQTSLPLLLAPISDSRSPSGMRHRATTVHFCERCKIWRPPRASHCHTCDRCIDVRDHHCRLLNNCVGIRTYRYYVSFLIQLNLLGLLVSTSSFVHVFIYKRHEHTSALHAIRHAPVSFAIAFYAITVTVIYPGRLLYQHIWLMKRGQKTRELVCGNGERRRYRIN
ncbi:DHHC palmitoyltransferase-domain-containing protein [Limtongia smithiae]|uniref:DHHC palmitoyltransferase-domain-containing protein n=1 Tax=Limtongia smithiae TaxID=1125753 RepID=UPI0034CD686F